VESSVPLIEERCRKGLRVLKFEMRGLHESGLWPGLKPDDPGMLQLLAAAGRCGVTVVFDPGPVGWGFCRPGDLREAVRRSPETRFVICHLGQPCMKVREDPALYAEWEDMLSLAAFPNVWFDVSAMPNLFSELNYPYAEASEFLRTYLSVYSEEKLIWGSDAPGLPDGMPYLQAFDMFLRWNVFSDQGLERLFAKNAMDAYWPA